MTLNKATVTEQTLLSDLVSLWQRRRTEGQSLTPSELCRDRPELLPALEKHIADLERMADLAAARSETATLDFVASPQAAAVPARWPTIPGYEILGELGCGGMGVVYKPRQTALSRLVALKMILSGGMAGEAELARFRTEFRRADSIGGRDSIILDCNYHHIAVVIYLIYDAR